MKAANCFCGASCPYASEKEPCWGEVNVLGEEPAGDGDYYWVHACEGHKDVYYECSGYKPEPKDTVRE